MLQKQENAKTPNKIEGISFSTNKETTAAIEPIIKNIH
jgi:hypothetical protein